MSRRRLPRREFLRLAGAGVLGGVAASALPGLLGAGCARRGRRPSFVFVLADDHAHDAMSCAGHPWIRTPGLDRLAGEGVRFSDAFVTCSLCSPSRASFLSGLYPHAHGVVANEARDLPPEVPTFPRLLQQAGWRTAFIGKWHMARTARPRPGFDHWVSFNGQGRYDRNTLNVDGRWELSRRYVTDELTDRALAFLREAAAGPAAAPFLLVLSHKAVHEPPTPAPRHAHLYDELPLAARVREAEAAASLSASQQRELARDRFLLDYARTLAAVDESTGAIVQALDQAGRLDDTVIVYAGDNGYMMDPGHERWGKRAAYESSIRIPLLARYPRGFRPGTVCAALALNLDLMPTILALAGLAPPELLPGLSLADLASGKATRQEFLYEYFKEQGAVPTTLALRTARYKYITYPENPERTRELYDLQFDPGETTNRLDEPAYAEVARQSAARLRELERETGFHLPGPPER